MTQTKLIQRVSKLKTAMVEASAELATASASRSGMQESMDAADAILREAYGDNFDEDVQTYLETDSEDDFSDEDFEDEEIEN